MTILAGDIKLVASQVMDDVDEGGGAPTATTITDGTSNSIFNDISELDRAIGRVSLRKVFAQVQTANVDGYFGANVIVADPPNDPNVSVSLFSTHDVFDTREAAQLRIESYLSQGPLYSGILYGNHIAGQGAVTILQRIGLEPPANGDTYVLRKNEGLISQTEQYVRVTKVTSRVRTFADANGDYSRLESTMTLSDVLRDDYPGFDALRYDSSIDFSGRSKFYTTLVADAARYYGVVPLTETAAIGDFTVQADSIFTQIVPSTRTEVPIADARMNQQIDAPVTAGAAFTQNLTLAFTTAQSLFIGGSVMPGSVSITRGGITLTDMGGRLMNGSSQVGLVDYSNGVLSLTTSVFGTSSGTHVITYTPAGTPTIVSQSVGIPITQEGQRLTYVVSLAPIPAKGTLQVSFRALAKWYVLTEDGSGAIRGGDSSFGAGTLNFTTGTVSLTLGALPDVGSELILTWVPAVVSRPLSALPVDGTTLAPAFGMTLTTGGIALKPGTLSLSWNDGTARTATDAAGLLIGAATGTIQYTAGHIEFRPNLLPPIGTTITLTCTDATTEAAHLTLTDGGATWTGALGGNVKARSFEMGIVGQYPMRFFPGLDQTVSAWVRVFDDGAGALKVADSTGNLTVGSIDYSSGAFSVSKSIAGYLVEQPTYASNTLLDDGDPVTSIVQTGFENRSVTLAMQNGAASATANPPWAWWLTPTGSSEIRFAGPDDGSATYTYTLDDIFLFNAARQFNGRYYADAPPDAFTLGTHRHVYVASAFDYVRDVSPTTGGGTVVGTKATNGDVYGARLTTWPSGVSSAPTDIGGATSPATSGDTSLLVVDTVTFRSAISPLFNGGFSVSGTFQDGTAFTATPDVDGVITTATGSVVGVVGKVNYETGVATLRFGKLGGSVGSTGVQDLSYLGITGVTTVTAAGVLSDSLRYNAVGFTYLPLDADILGLDPVRLPTDGRVPIFRAGSVAVVGNTATVGPATVTNGQTVDCGRVRLSRVRIIDADGAVINTGYTTDLEAGTVTFTSVSGYAQPVTVEHRVEDMALVSDAQINGQITFTRPLTHAYSTTGSYVSSALIAGDLHARVSTSFDQATWTNTWSDDRIGSAASGTFNTIANPLVVANKGALTERWAIVFTNTTAFNIIGEHIGVIGTGNTATNCAPTNPSTSTPYFTIPAAGWGAGWAAGNAFRFNTVGAEYPVWVIRTTQQGAPTVDDDEFTLLIRGDVDAP
jgi:hypothetical protein